ncbi:MAG: TRAP transporter fused permease subunit [Thermodesulfobacteriota bacterium]
MLDRMVEWINRVFLVIGTIFTLYIFTTIFELFQEPAEHYTTFVLGTAILSSLLTIRDILQGNAKGFKFWASLVVFLSASVVFVLTAIYMRYRAIELNTIQPFIENMDIFIGFFVLASMLILTWYHWGTILTSVILLSILYFFLGHVIDSEIFRHDKFALDFAMSYMGLDTVAGIFYFVPLAADKIYFLIIFAALLIGIGMLPLVLELGKLVGRHVRGGAAFPAIVGSAMTGSVMGQAVSNVMLTGQLTIPIMKKSGMKPDLAGAIEAVASTSGQLLPPILGLAAFMIAATLNIAYIEVALAAGLPAFLYIGGVVLAILLAARKANLGFLTDDIDMRLILRLLPTFAASFIVVLVLLLLFYSPNVAAIAGIGVMFALCFFQGKGLRPSFRTLVKGFVNGLEVCTILCLLLVALGPLAQAASTTNLAGKLSTVMSGIVPDNLFVVLIGAMVVSLIMGMGLPTPVAYLVVALTLAPTLQELGLPALYAHMFVFYFAIFSTISPPVAIACLAGAKLSGGTFMGTAKEAMKLALPTFVIPFAFVYNPDLLIFPRVTISGMFAFLVTMLVMVGFSVAFFGYFWRKLILMERVLFGLASMFGFIYLVHNSTVTLLVFFGLSAAVALWVIVSSRKMQPAEA